MRKWEMPTSDYVKVLDIVILLLLWSVAVFVVVVDQVTKKNLFFFDQGNTNKPSFDKDTLLVSILTFW